MKRLILILLVVLTASALAYRLPTAWTLGGGLAYDSVRVTAYRAETGSATLTNEVDTSFVGAGTSGSFALFVDSMVQYTVLYTYFSGTDTLREFSYGNTPVDYEKFSRASIQAVRDSMDEAAQIGASNGSGIYAVTLYARDTVNGAFVSGINLTAVNGATTYYATTDTSGSATFNVDGATWTFNASGSPYTWVPFSRAVGAGITDTITGGGFVVVAAADPDEASVYGTVDCYYCDVRFTLMSAGQSVTDTSTGYLVSETVKDTTTNSAGQFSMPLKKTGNMLYTSGSSRKHPIWNVRISPTDVEKEVRWFKDFEVPSDSTSLHIGEVR